jgi:hypothetical protein
MSKAAYGSDLSQRAKTLNAGQDRRNARSSHRKGFRPAARSIAFSSEVDAGSREENASKQDSRASVLIQSEPIML